MDAKIQKALTLAAATILIASESSLAEVQHYQVNEVTFKALVSDDSWQPEGFTNGISIPAVYIDQPGIVVDGRELETAWLEAQEVQVPLTYGRVKHVYLKAVYTDDKIYIRLRWADATENRQHHPWVWSEDLERYVEGEQVEDSAILSFEAGCEWTPSLLSGYVFDFDGWQWLAARSDPLGQALDLSGTMQDRDRSPLNFTPYSSRNEADVWNVKFTENIEPDLHARWDEQDRAYFLQPHVDTVWYRAEPDGYRPPPFVERVGPPEVDLPSAGSIVPQYRPVRLEGEAGEVAAKGQWENGYWTVEFGRDLVTPARTLNDAVFNRLTQFSVHIFDAVEQIDQSSESERLFLEFRERERLDEDLRVAKE